MRLLTLGLLFARRNGDTIEIRVSADATALHYGIITLPMSGMIHMLFKNASNASKKRRLFFIYGPSPLRMYPSHFNYYRHSARHNHIHHFMEHHCQEIIMLKEEI